MLEWPAARVSSDGIVFRPVINATDLPQPMQKVLVFNSVLKTILGFMMVALFLIIFLIVLLSPKTPEQKNS